MVLIAFLSFILGRPVFFLFLFLDGNNGVILFHKTSGTSYSESTPVISDITIDHKRVQDGLALSYKYSMAKTQLISITFRIGSYSFDNYCRLCQEEENNLTDLQRKRLQ